MPEYKLKGLIIVINSPADKILDCATLITTETSTSHSSATGFFFDFHIEGLRVPVLVSNRHVLEKFDKVTFQIRSSTSSDKNEQLTKYHRATINAERANVDIILHPQENIDLAIMPLADLFRQTESKGEHIANHFITEKDVVSSPELQSLSAIEDLVMSGCPYGIYDSFNHLPIIRRGVTASHPAYDFGGDFVFLSDIACFPGSSGSPIFLYSPFGYADYQSKAYTIGKSKVKLLGIQCRAYSHTATNQFLNLAIAQKAHLLLDFKPILTPMLNL